jgi:hypothetical protein
VPWGISQTIKHDHLIEQQNWGSVLLMGYFLGKIIDEWQKKNGRLGNPRSHWRFIAGQNGTK